MLHPTAALHSLCFRLVVGQLNPDKAIKIMKNRVILVLINSLLYLILSACDFPKEADQKFALQIIEDQHFKTAIALIELHKVRFGEYPNSLNDLKFTGKWDQITLNIVTYKRVGNGYELSLDVEQGWGKSELKYPDEFWKGLGLVKSNMKSPPTVRHKTS